MQLAIASGIPPAALAEEPTEVIATMVELMNEQTERMRTRAH